MQNLINGSRTLRFALQIYEPNIEILLEESGISGSRSDVSQSCIDSSAVTRVSPSRGLNIRD
jgi:hypothetical protein